MFLRQVLTARFEKNTFTAYKYKKGYLIRKVKLNDNVFVTVWNEYDSFAAVVESLKWFERDTYLREDDDDDALPF